MKKYLLSIDPKIYKEFRSAAKRDGRTMRWLIEQFMLQFVQDKKRKPKTKLLRD